MSIFIGLQKTDAGTAMGALQRYRITVLCHLLTLRDEPTLNVATF
jgi:hypothetical protein